MLALLGHVILPVFGLIALGFVLRRRGILTATGSRELGQLLYWVCLPAQLVLLTSRVDVTRDFDPRMLGAVALALLAGLVAGWRISARLPAAMRGCVLNGAARANGAFIGLPVVDLAARALAPEQHAALVGTYAVLLGPTVILFNIAAVTAFRLPHHGLSWSGVRQALADLPRSPLILGCALGGILGAWSPGLLDGTVPGTLLALVAACAIPLALICAGVDLDLSHVREHPRIIAATVALKLILVPATTWALCHLLGVDRHSTFCAVVLMASPTAIASVPMARLLGGDAGLMAALVTATTLTAPVTMLGWLLLVGP